MQNKYQTLKKWFQNYTSQFELKSAKDQKNIDLKIAHSYRVTADTMEIIKQMSQKNKTEKYLAKIIALYHDIGRFKQYQKYRTFSDYKSEDHGNLGAALIKKNNLIADLTVKKQNIIYQAIKNHNQKNIKIESFKNQQEIFFTRLIRDADKLDIFNIFVKRYKNKNQKDYIIKLKDKPTISKKIYNKTLNGQAINYDQLESINDLKIMQLGWIYDINFKETKKIIQKRNYLEIIYNSMDKSKKTKKLYKRIKRELLK